MRRIADLYPGEAKTDAKDAFIIADASRAMPHTLRSIDLEDETIAELEMIVGFDDDPAGEATRVANRIHGLRTQIHPSLEQVLGPRLQHPAVLTLLERCGSPARSEKPAAADWSRCCGRNPADGRATGRGHLHRAGRTDRGGARHRGGLADRPKPGRLSRRCPRPAQTAGRANRRTTGVPPSFEGPDLDAGSRHQDRSQDPHRIGDGSNFPSAAHLAAYAGLAPATRNSGSSIRGEQPSKRGNKQLKRAFPLSAFAALCDPASRAYHDKKISHRTFCQPQPATAINRSSSRHAAMRTVHDHGQ